MRSRASLAGVVQTKDPRRILVFGRKVGGTTIYVTNAHGQVNAYSVDVVRESGQAAAALTARSSDSKVKVRPAGNGLTIDTTISDSASRSTIPYRSDPPRGSTGPDVTLTTPPLRRMADPGL